MQGGLLADAPSVPTVFVITGCGLLLLTGVLWRLLVVHRDLIAQAFDDDDEP